MESFAGLLARVRDEMETTGEMVGGRDKYDGGSESFTSTYVPLRLEFSQ